MNERLSSAHTPTHTIRLTAPHLTSLLWGICWVILWLLRSRLIPFVTEGNGSHGPKASENKDHAVWLVSVLRHVTPSTQDLISGRYLRDDINCFVYPCFSVEHRLGSIDDPHFRNYKKSYYVLTHHDAPHPHLSLQASSTDTQRRRYADLPWWNTPQN